jgi:acetyltransferase (GNAT) family protein
MLAVAWPSWRWTALMLAPWRTEEERAAPPLYAHKVTVDRAYGGHGLGGELLDWAGTRAADEGSDWLRVEVWTTNERLQHYLRQGFTCVRTVVLPHNPAGALFQRPAQPRPPRPARPAMRRGGTWAKHARVPPRRSRSTG